MGARAALAGSGFLLALAIALTTGCSSVGSSAVPTGPLRLPPRAGPVAVFAAGVNPPGAQLGVVEVHGSQSEAEIDELMPELVRRVAQLGGDAVAIDSVRARFDVVTHPFAESYTYPCGFYVCTGTRMYSTNDEVMTVTVRGRAFRMGGASPKEAP